MVVYQPARGFRYGSEAFWLVGFALEGGRARTAVDLGTGSGIAALLLAARGVAATGVDIRPEWAAGWTRSLAESRVPAAVDLQIGDVRHLSLDPVDLAVSNPPFFPHRSGPIAQDPWRAAARTESGATLDDFVATAIRLAGRACFVVPVERGDEVVAAASRRGWGPVRRVHVGRRRALLDLRPGGSTAPVERVAETDAVVARWYAFARGTAPRPGGRTDP